jgi:hypothetical protein
MSFKRLEESLDIIQSITGSADNNYGLTEKEMRAKFDEAANIIKTYINNTLIPALEASGVEKTVQSANLAEIRIIRLGTDNTLQVSADGVVWNTIASSGHVVYDENGYVFETWIGTFHNGIRMRTGGLWETGWSVKE